MNVIKREIMACEGEDGMVYNVEIQGDPVDQVQEFKYLGRMMNDRGAGKVG